MARLLNIAVRLEALARKAGRSKLNTIRWAVLRLANAEEEPE